MLTCGQIVVEVPTNDVGEIIAVVQMWGKLLIVAREWLVVYIYVVSVVVYCFP